MLIDELGHDGDSHGGWRSGQNILDLRILEFPYRKRNMLASHVMNEHINTFYILHCFTVLLETKFWYSKKSKPFPFAKLQMNALKVSLQRITACSCVKEENTVAKKKTTIFFSKQYIKPVVSF